MPDDDRYVLAYHLPDETQPWACQSCGVLVIDRPSHDSFHELINRASRVAHRFGPIA